MEDKLSKIMEMMPYGLYIVGSGSDDSDDGMMADWVMQVSFRPRMIAVALENDAHTLDNIRGSRAFTVNLLSQDEPGMAIARRFAQPYLDSKVAGRQGTVRTHQKLEGVGFTRAANGCALLDEATAWLECRAENFYPAGDHVLVVGLVTSGDLRREGDLLTSTYTGWNYGG